MDPIENKMYKIKPEKELHTLGFIWNTKLDWSNMIKGGKSSWIKQLASRQKAVSTISKKKSALT